MIDPQKQSGQPIFASTVESQLLSDNISASRPMLSHHQRTYDLCLLRWILMFEFEQLQAHRIAQGDWPTEYLRCAV
ncbi:hypothetical protein H9L39_10117 [Fusarium oxysporum f. sp. albedinis]|nr:hypothetical protein H9L39_10117 [Fusarium oxysporum f. sp. albedinis]